MVSAEAANCRPVWRQALQGWSVVRSLASPCRLVRPMKPFDCQKDSGADSREDLRTAAWQPACQPANFQGGLAGCLR